MGKQQGECRTTDTCGCNKTDHSNKETTMKSGTRDKAEGAFHELKGTIKEAAGKLSDNPKLQVEGTVEKLSGKVQEKVGQVKQVFGR